MLIELTEEQQKNLLVILGDTNIKGAQWRVIAELEKAINNPIKNEVKNDCTDTNK